MIFLEMSSRFSFLFEHDLFRKPLHTTGANFRPVTREPDPRIRRKKKSRLKMMDCRVKPGNDSADRSRSNTLGITLFGIMLWFDKRREQCRDYGWSQSVQTAVSRIIRRRRSAAPLPRAHRDRNQRALRDRFGEIGVLARFQKRAGKLRHDLLQALSRPSAQRRLDQRPATKMQRRARILDRGADGGAVGDIERQPVQARHLAQRRQDDLARRGAGG
ncbi:MAG: hypothetical protein K8H87_03830, partial [Pseudorhodoplanes sp.]|nr:hypothetical protein [Pseudorhodoplanes sp.]